MNKDILEPNLGEYQQTELVGHIVSIRRMITAHHELMAIITLHDEKKIAVFPKSWESYSQDLESLMTDKTEVSFDCIVTGTEYILKDFTKSIALHEIVSAFTNYEKLSDALQKDMRAASNKLLHAFYYLEYASRNYTDSRKNFAAAILEDVKAALLVLDCSEFIDAVSDEDKDGKL
jgi:DNA polymerase III alpha subunit